MTFGEKFKQAQELIDGMFGLFAAQWNRTKNQFLKVRDANMTITDRAGQKCLTHNVRTVAGAVSMERL